MRPPDGIEEETADAEGEAGEPIAGVPEVASDGQGGLLDIALSPQFASDQTIYFSFSEPRDGGNGTSVAKARLVEDGGTASLEDLEIIFRQMPTYDGDKHFGSRIVPDGQGGIFVTLGERSDVPIRDTAQADDGNALPRLHAAGVQHRAHGGAHGAARRIWIGYGVLFVALVIGAIALTDGPLGGLRATLVVSTSPELPQDSETASAP